MNIGSHESMKVLQKKISNFSIKTLELLLLKETKRHLDFICIFSHFFIILCGALSRYNRCQSLKINFVSYGYMSENKF